MRLCRYRIEPLQPGWAQPWAQPAPYPDVFAQGAAVTAIRLAEMPDDPSECRYEESLLDLVLNVKQVRFRMARRKSAPRWTVPCVLRSDGAGELTAATSNSGGCRGSGPDRFGERDRRYSLRGRTACGDRPGYSPRTLARRYRRICCPLTPCYAVPR